MSFSTVGIPAAAIVWAIWPPIVPAPTTAALNTNIDFVSSDLIGVPPGPAQPSGPAPRTPVAEEWF